METETYILPVYWASYLINGDASGLEDDEQQECDDFLATIPERMAVDCDEWDKFVAAIDLSKLPAGIRFEFKD